MTKQERLLLKRVKAAEDRLSGLVTKLWKLVDPEQNEIDVAIEVMNVHDDNWNPTDLEVLRHVLSCRH